MQGIPQQREKRTIHMNFYNMKKRKYLCGNMSGVGTLGPTTYRHHHSPRTQLSAINYTEGVTALEGGCKEDRVRGYCVVDEVDKQMSERDISINRETKNMTVVKEVPKSRWTPKLPGP